jgi:hypothetical protein
MKPRQCRQPAWPGTFFTSITDVSKDPSINFVTTTLPALVSYGLFEFLNSAAKQSLADTVQTLRAQ